MAAYFLSAERWREAEGRPCTQCPAAPAGAEDGLLGPHGQTTFVERGAGAGQLCWCLCLAQASLLPALSCGRATAPQALRRCSNTAKYGGGGEPRQAAGQASEQRLLAGCVWLRGEWPECARASRWQLRPAAASSTRRASHGVHIRKQLSSRLRDNLLPAHIPLAPQNPGAALHPGPLVTDRRTPALPAAGQE